MFVKPLTNKTATIHGETNEVIVMSDDGFEDILDFRVPCASETAARAYLKEIGFVERAASDCVLIYNYGADRRSIGPGFFAGEV